MVASLTLLIFEFPSIARDLRCLENLSAETPGEHELSVHSAIQVPVVTKSFNLITESSQHSGSFSKRHQSCRTRPPFGNLFSSAFIHRTSPSLNKLINEGRGGATQPGPGGRPSPTCPRSPGPLESGDRRGVLFLSLSQQRLDDNRWPEQRAQHDAGRHHKVEHPVWEHAPEMHVMNLLSQLLVHTREHQPGQHPSQVSIPPR